MELPQSIATLILVLGVTIVLFIILRSLVLWYWKVDELITLQKRQVRAMEQQSNILLNLYKLNGGLEEILDFKVKTSALDSKKAEIERKAKLYDQGIK